MPYKNDLVMLGLLCGLVGSVVWLKGGIWRPNLTLESATFWGSNPFVIKSIVFQRWENIVAAFWIMLGFALSAMGTYQAIRNPGAREKWFASGYALWISVLAAVLVSVGSFTFADWMAKREFHPVLVAMQREALTYAAGLIRRDGLEEREAQPGAVVVPDQHVRNQRIKSALRNLRIIGTLFELPRQGGESDLAYVERLEDFFARFPGPVVKDDLN